MITTSDGLTLESELWPAHRETRGLVVFCHPHPLHGGTMNAPLMRAVAGTLVDSGLAVLRFNFRGVGASQGTWGNGDLEMLDVAAAVAHAAETHPGVRLGVAGWSFGAVTSLRWHLQARSPLPWAGIAPAVRGYAGSAPVDPANAHEAPRLIVIGERDQLIDVSEVSGLAEALGAQFEVIPASDHFFHFRERVVGELLATHFGGDASV